MKKRLIKPAVIGLGYVGLPIFFQLQKKFETIGYDINQARIQSLKKKKDIFNEFNKKDFKVQNNSIFTYQLEDLKKANFFIVTVPTPIKKNNTPDLSLIKKSCYQLKKILKKDDIIFFESTVYPGVSDNICIPILNKSGLTENKDFFVGYSPERINPGDNTKNLKKISKIVAFRNKQNLSKVKSIYKMLSKNIVITNNLMEAETSKVIENIQRDLNIGLINEIYKVCNVSKINFSNVMRLAKSKWNFVPYEPGLVGGHCLPVDPYYFSYFAKKKGIKTNILLAGRNINNSMYKFVLKSLYKKIKKKSKILFLGLTYKKNVADIRNSFALKIYNQLKKKYKSVDAYDPLLFKQKIKNIIIKKNINLKIYNCIILAVPHISLIKLLKKNNIKNYLELFQNE